MRTVQEIEGRLDDIVLGRGDLSSRQELLELGEAVLALWIRAKSKDPMTEKHEGFRLLALHRQGARNDPSFNACRETCRELVYHFNLILLQQSENKPTDETLHMMALVANHLVLFVGGKMNEAGLGDFCCSSRPLHQDENLPAEINDA